jgi:hypothetical protein
MLRSFPTGGREDEGAAEAAVGVGRLGSIASF